MTQNNSHDRDEQRFAELLRTVNADVPPPDRERLAALREQSAKAYLECCGPSHSFPTDADPPKSDVAPSTNPTNDHSVLKSDDSGRRSPKGSTPMTTLVMRGLAALAASAAIIVTALVMPQPKPVIAGSVPFSEVLAELRGAETLQFRLVKSSGNAAEIWVRAPGLVRKEESPQRYEIAAGSRLWRVNEAENTVKEGDSPWFLSPDKQIEIGRAHV